MGESGAILVAPKRTPPPPPPPRTLGAGYTPLGEPVDPASRLFHCTAIAMLAPFLLLIFSMAVLFALGIAICAPIGFLLSLCRRLLPGRRGDDRRPGRSPAAHRPTT